jgi:hypothetical protein
MGLETEKSLRISNEIELLIEKIVNRCYDLYGHEQHEKYASLIIQNKDYSFVYDEELNNLIKNMLHLEEEQSKINPFYNMFDDNLK